MSEFDDKMNEARRKAIESMNNRELNEIIFDGRNCAGCLGVIGIIHSEPKYVERTARPMQDVCEAATKCKNSWDVNRLLYEVEIDKDQYSKSHYGFMIDFLTDIKEKLAEKDTTTHTITYYDPNDY